MSSKQNSSILPWIEASTLLGATLVAAIATSAISLYRIDSIEEKVDGLVEAISSIGIIKNEIISLKNHDKEAQVVFTRFADSVDRLTVAVAKLEVRQEGK